MCVFILSALNLKHFQSIESVALVKHCNGKHHYEINITTLNCLNYSHKLIINAKLFYANGPKSLLLE